MTFENRAGEYLFLGDLQVPTSAAQPDETGHPNPSAMVVDTEPIYLGGVQVNDINTTAPTSAIEKPKDVALTNLTDCTINLVHTLPLGAIHIKNLKRCVLVIPPVSGSILLHDCEGCTLIGACHQVRLKSVCYFTLSFIITYSQNLSKPYISSVCLFFFLTKMPIV